MPGAVTLLALALVVFLRLSTKPPGRPEWAQLLPIEAEGIENTKKLLRDLGPSKFIVWIALSDIDGVLIIPLWVWMTPVTRQKVLGLYRRIFRIAKTWQSASGQMEGTVKEKQYILNEAKTLFQKNKHLTDPELIKQCVEECEARIELGLHYNNPYPRPIHLPPMGLAPQRGRVYRHQEKLRKISKPVYLKSHDEIS